MQAHTASPRTALTDAQVIRLLQGAPDVHYAYGANLLDFSLNVVDTIDLLGGQVRRNNLGNIHGTCDLELDVDVSWYNRLVQPWMELSAEGVTARWNVGVYAMTTPDNAYTVTEPRRRRVQGYDRLYLLSREIGNSWVAPAGQGVLSEVRRAITAAGLTGVELDTTAESATLPTAMTWPLVRPIGAETPLYDQTKREQQTGLENATTWLRVVNDLLFSINYRGLYADPATGVFRSGPYVAPEARPVEHLFNFDDAQNSIVSPERTVSEDRWKAPNRWVFIRTNMPGDPPPEPVVGAGLYVVDHSGTDPRGLVWSQQVPLDVVDQATLVAQGDNRVKADERIQTRLSVTTAPFPAAGHADVYRYTDTLMGRDSSVQAVEFSLDLTGADMTHIWEVI